MIYSGKVEKTNYLELSNRLIELAMFFPTQADIFLFGSYRAISKNDRPAQPTSL